jgi:trans-aconitate methyltransferase
VVRLDSDESLNRHHKPYRSPTVQGITADFLTFKPKQRFDICLCLQVLEHIPDARAFAQKLLASSPRVLISVPYLWAADSHVQHVHDPIDEAKVVAWFGQSPSFSMISTEHRTGVRRLICYFEELGWKRRLEKILSRQC